MPLNKLSSRTLFSDYGRLSGAGEGAIEVKRNEDDGPDAPINLKAVAKPKPRRRGAKNGCPLVPRFP